MTLQLSSKPNHQEHKARTPDWVLAIDDVRTFPKKDSKGRWIIPARNIEQAMTWLEKYEVAEIWLDHDLGKNQAGEIEDIRPVVRYIEAIAKNGGWAPKIRILTSNPVGRQYIQLALEGCSQILK